MKAVRFLACLAAALSLVAQAPDAIALQRPATAFGAIKITVTTTATSLAALAKTANGSEIKKYECGWKLHNPSTTIVCLGGSDVDCTTHYVPICAASTCVEASHGIAADLAATYAVVAGGTQVAYLEWVGGC